MKEISYVTPEVEEIILHSEMSFLTASGQLGDLENNSFYEEDFV